jgi:hypothetical protein
VDERGNELPVNGAGIFEVQFKSGESRSINGCWLSRPGNVLPGLRGATRTARLKRPGLRPCRCSQELAAKTLRKAKQAANDGDTDTANSLTSVAMHHFLHGHHALKSAHWTKDGNYLSANRSSTDVAKALVLAKYAFDSEKDMSGRQALHWAMQGLAVMRSGLARAKLAEPLEKVQREQRLTKCVVQDDRPLATIAKCW